VNAKTYIVTRGSGGQIGCLIRIPGRRNCLLLRECCFHSQAGFETGAAGGGPSDLALSILLDYYGEDPAAAAQKVRESSWLHPAPKAIEQAWRLHQAFKQSFLAHLQIERNKSFEIPGETIERWIVDCEVTA
jgi:hypothetical protein